MSDLIVLAFDNEEGAFKMRDKLFQLQKQHLIMLADAAVVIRKPDGARPRAHSVQRRSDRRRTG